MMRKLTILASLLILLLGISPLIETFAQAGTAQVGFFEAYQVRPGRRIEVPVEVRAVADLYAVDIEIGYDPGLLAFEDADPTKPGVQPALGTFLDAGLTLLFEVDEDEGLVRFVMTQVNPAEPKSGDGVLLVLYFLGLQEGESDLSVNFVEMATRFGEEVPSAPVDTVVTISSAAEERETTPIPVQDPTLMIPIPTLTETPAAIETPEMDEPVDEAVEEPEATQQTLDEVETDAVPEQVQREEDGGFSLLRHWWIVLLSAAVAGALSVYYFVIRNK